MVPVKDERAGEWPVVWVFDQARADGVFKNVRGYTVEALAGTKNVVVIAPLPEIAYPQRASAHCGHAFECTNSFSKIRRFCEGCGKSVTMIRHKAIGENGESLFAKLTGKFARQQFDQGWIGEELAALTYANR